MVWYLITEGSARADTGPLVANLGRRHRDHRIDLLRTSGTRLVVHAQDHGHAGSTVPLRRGHRGGRRDDASDPCLCRCHCAAVGVDGGARHSLGTTADRQGISRPTRIHRGRIDPRAILASRVTGVFHYPLSPMHCAPQTKPNVLMLVVDSLRWDMLTSEVMPKTAAWARRRDSIRAPLQYRQWYPFRHLRIDVRIAGRVLARGARRTTRASTDRCDGRTRLPVLRLRFCATDQSGVQPHGVHAHLGSRCTTRSRRRRRIGIAQQRMH